MYLQDKNISLVPNNLVCPKCGKSHYVDQSTSYCLSVYRMPIYKDGKLVDNGGETTHTDYRFECLECGTVFDNKGNMTLQDHLYRLFHEQYKTPLSVLFEDYKVLKEAIEELEKLKAEK